jgi:glutamate---cysteine ligase / carboxylate-amine ligase
VIPSRFGESAPLSLGVEEEVMILDAATLEPAAAVQTLVEGARDLGLPGLLKTELHASVVELNTGICSDADQAVAALRELRAGAAEVARARGLVLAAAGAHPTASPESLPVVPEERYEAMLRRLGRSARRQGVNGLHVHVGVESGENCLERLEAVLPWLPVILALSANSPFVEGVDSGDLSVRASVLGELPRSGAPPLFGSYASWEAWVERLVGLGVLEDETRIWWDVRPHPRLGTLEIRIADQPTALARTELLVRLLRDLVQRAPERVPEPAARGDYAQNRWVAARFGLDAELIHPDGDRTIAARDLAAELLGGSPPEPEALRQLDVARREGQAAVVADLVRRTVA